MSIVVTVLWVLVSAGSSSASAEARTPVSIAVPANGTAVFDADGVNIRETPRLNSRINGKGYNGQGADLRCARDGDLVGGISTWYRLTNRDTGVTGWVHYSFLREVFWTNPEGGC
ncbi:SH3 domain-containing protein [Umezawaea beigongshangensis]|uniref:SH3 domain-containing protein n=1 Tax=Umezawaea beigongshangensis TaxID=2780383 RepID=UPI0018F23E23|nr:SH3 domain-containing protein [Umezawaea beigongshangensis]